MSATIIDTITDNSGITLQITEMKYGKETRYGVREVMAPGRWCPIGGTTRSLEGAYQRVVAIWSEDPEWLAIRKSAHIDHLYRFQQAA